MSRDKTRDGPDSLCIYIDYDEIDEPKQENIQKLLNDMDKVELHGKPKIAVVECTVPIADLNVDLVVPGPDYLILTVKYTTRCKSRPARDASIYPSTDDFIDEFRCDADVENVCVNSSLNKRYLREKNEPKTSDARLSGADTVPSSAGHRRVQLNSPPPDQLLITADNRGKALIICNQHEIQPWMDEKERRTVPLRKEVLRRAKVVFEVLLGLKVTVEYDLTADEMKRSVSEFSKSEGHGSLVALAIFSHGYKRKISGADSNSECSVQEVVDSLCGGNIGNVPKLLFLSFCRGELRPQYNRARHSFESGPQFPWPENEIGMRFQPVRQTLPVQLREEWKNTLPSLDVPVDCYICFTTLPDSKSRPGEFFKALLEHLSEISRMLSTDSGHQPRNVSDTEPPVDTPPLDVTNSQVTDRASTNTTCQTRSRVELVTLLTDVAGILKEVSRSTQYVNICYTLNRHSKQVLVNVLPTQIVTS